MGVDPIGGLEKTVPGYDAARQAYRSAGNEQQTAQQTVQGQEPVSLSLQRNSNTMGRLETVNEEKNLFARNIRATDKALQEISTAVEKMKSHLDTIVKNWPPFPPDSSERKDLLMSYAALRKQILSMTFPPPPPPVYEKNTSLWEKFGYNNDAQQLSHTVPDITETATDVQVSSARDGIETLQAAVSQGRSELVRAVTE
jgi:hypothetical protein